jgi:hypothetical protein
MKNKIKVRAGENTVYIESPLLGTVSVTFLIYNGIQTVFIDSHDIPNVRFAVSATSDTTITKF